MPRPTKQARLWLAPAERDPSGKVTRPARWFIKDGGRKYSTGCGEGDRAEAEARLAAHISSRHEPDRRQRELESVLVADVINIYLRDIVPDHARPEKSVERAERLLDFFGHRYLSEVNGALCRDYVASRAGQGRTNKGSGGGAKRDLEDLRSAINHHLKEGLHRGLVRVVLPPRGTSRQRWMTRDEAAQLLMTCWRTREWQDGKPTDKRPLRHLCRFLILGLYTGSRPGAILSASWERAPGTSFVDLRNGLFHRHAQGKVENNKRQPSVRISPRLNAHLVRWYLMDGGLGSVVKFRGHPVASIDKALQRAVKESGIDPGVTAYTLRHSAGSWLVNKGLRTRQVADFLGTSEAMIERHYGHLAPDYQDHAANAIGKK